MFLDKNGIKLGPFWDPNAQNVPIGNWVPKWRGGILFSTVVIRGIRMGIQNTYYAELHKRYMYPKACYDHIHLS